MRKSIKKKFLAAFISAGMIAGSVGIMKTEASSEKYCDNNVSLLTAIDGYVETNEYAFADDLSKVTNVAASDVNTVGSVVNITVDSVNKEKKETSKVTGSIVVADSNAEENEDVADSKTEEITEEATTEETTEETTTEDTATQSTEDESSADESVEVSYQDFTGKAIVTASGYVNIRSGASTDDSIVATINNGGLANVEEKGNEWSLVSSGDCRGYIKNDLVAFDDDARSYAEANLTKIAKITASALTLRAGESTDSECLSMLPNGETYRVLEIGSAWTKVEVDDTLSGYVSNEFIEIGYNTSSATAADTSNDDSSDDTSEEATEEPSDDSSDDTTEATEETSDDDSDEGSSDVPASPVGVDVVNYALGFVGNPYVYGGTDLVNGADCSGFVMRIYEHFGYQLPRTADVQAEVGTPISLAALAPGDLLFYDHGSGSIQHVAIYMGDGRIVHASNSVTGITTSNAYYSTPCKAVRIIN